MTALFDPEGSRRYRRRNPPQSTSQRALRARYPLREGRSHRRDGELVTYSGVKTGRSPKDKRVVRHPELFMSIRDRRLF